MLDEVILSNNDRGALFLTTLPFASASYTAVVEEGSITIHREVR